MFGKLISCLGGRRKVNQSVVVDKRFFAIQRPMMKTKYACVPNQFREIKLKKKVLMRL